MLWENTGICGTSGRASQTGKNAGNAECFAAVSRTALFLSDEKELEHLGVQPLVMKGIVCRNLYPKPDLRPSGDEDLLIPAKDFAAVDACFYAEGLCAGQRSRNAGWHQRR